MIHNDHLSKVALAPPMALWRVDPHSEPRDDTLAGSAVQLGYFGIAKHFGTAARTMDQVTQAGNLLGTLYYMPPELASAELSPAYDVWALGVMLYEMVAGKRPFADAEELGVGEYFAAVRAGQYPKLSTVVPGGGARLDGLIAGMLQADPDQRIKDGAQAADAIWQVAVELGGAPGAAGQEWKATKARPAAVVPQTGAVSGATRPMAIQSGPTREASRAAPGPVLPSKSGGAMLAIGGLGAILIAGALMRRGGGEVNAVVVKNVGALGTSGADQSLQSLRHEGAALTKLLAANAKNLNEAWLRAFAAKHRLQLKKEPKAVSDALRSYLDGDLHVLAPVNQFLAHAGKYFSDESIPIEERWKTRSALCDLELVEYFCNEHQVSWPLTAPLVGCAGDWDKPLIPGQIKLAGQPTWIVAASTKADSFFPGETHTTTWSLPVETARRNALLWFSTMYWRSGMILDVQIDQRARRLMRPFSGQTDPGPIDVLATEYRVFGQTQRGARVRLLSGPERNGFRGYMGMWIPNHCLSSRVVVSTRMIDIPMSQVAMRDPELVDRLVTLSQTANLHAVN